MATYIQLEIASGPNAGQQIRVANEKVTFGRTEHANIVLDWDNLTSALHFQIHPDGANYCLLDLGSTNGTFLNGQKVSNAKLSDGDKVQVGDTQFIVHDPSGTSDQPSDAKGDSGAPNAAAFNPFSSQQPDAERKPATPASDTVKSGRKEGVQESALSSVVLRVTSALENGATFTVGCGQPTTFGRTTQSDVSLGFDGMLSSIHFRIVCQSDQCTIEDLRSANGTWLDGNGISTARLNHGDRFRAGRTEFVVEFNYAHSQQPGSRNAKQQPNNSAKVVASECAGGVQKWQSEPSDTGRVVETIETFRALGNLYLLIDFSRIDLPIPDELPVEQSSLFDWFPVEASQYSPQLLSLSEYEQWPSLIEAGWEQDAIVGFCSQHEKPELLQGLRDLAVWKSGQSAQRRSVRGICWPAVLSALLENNSDEIGQKLFAIVDLAFIQSFDTPESWQAFGSTEVLAKAAELGFTPVASPKLSAP